MPAFQILPPSSERREYYRDPLPQKEEVDSAEEGVGIFICVALQHLDLSKTHGAYLFYAPLRNLEPVNLNPEPVAPATRLERKETHLFFFRQSFEDAHGV